MIDLPKCPSGRTNCLFEMGAMGMTFAYERRLVDRTGNVHLKNPANQTTTSAKCDTCGEVFLGKAGGFGSPTDWELVAQTPK